MGDFMSNDHTNACGMKVSKKNTIYTIKSYDTQRLNSKSGSFIHSTNLHSSAIWENFYYKKAVAKFPQEILRQLDVIEYIKLVIVVLYQYLPMSFRFGL